MKEAIKMRKKSATRWNTDTFKERMKEINPNIKILGEYVNAKTKIKCICLVCGYDDWYPTAESLLSGHGCPKCQIKRRSELQKKSQKDFENDLYKTNPNLEIVGKYININTDILTRCKIDGYTWEANPYYLLHGCGCPVCSNHRTVKGINDIATTRPDLIKYFDNIEDAYSSTEGSSKKHNLHCPFCLYKKKLSNSILSKYGFSCPVCSDNISYPNKFSRAFIKQLPVENFIAEYSPYWAGRKRYDNYFEYNGQAYILEMDGAWHYKDNNMSNQSAEISKNIDNEKDIMAKEHNIIVIRIDCKKSEKDYIKNNIIDSCLNDLFDLSNIDWDLCNKMGHKNLIKEVCDYYMNVSKVIKEISIYFSIHRKTIERYLMQGYECGWCTYKGKRNNCKNGGSASKAINVFKDGKLVHSFCSVTQGSIDMRKIYNTVFNKGQITDCCKGRKDFYKGFQFTYA